MSEEEAKTAPQNAQKVSDVAPPSNEQVKGKRKSRFGTTTDPNVGAATRIKKGEVRNPTGRPKKHPNIDGLYKVGLKRVPKAMVEALIRGGFPGLKYGVTYAELGAVGQYMKIAKGEVANLDLVTKLLGEQKHLEQPQQQSQTPLINFGRIELEDGSARQQLSVATARIRERIAKREPLTIDAR